MNAKQMIRSAIAGAAIVLLGASAQAGVIGAGDLVVNALGVFDITNNQFADNSYFSVTSDSRTGSASSDYNGITGTGIGAGSITAGNSQPVDVKYRCAGPDCATVSALYGGNAENNTTTHLAAPAQKNFALGDMFISGTALNNTANGLTRADASATQSDNQGGAQATIQNSASVNTTFVAGNSFAAQIVMNATAFTKAFVDAATPPNAATFASGSVSWSLTIRDVTQGFPQTTILSFSPDEINGFTGVFASTAGQSQEYNFNGNLGSAVVNVLAGHTYNLVITQSSLATVSEVPEPASLALVGVALLGLAGAASARRRQSK